MRSLPEHRTFRLGVLVLAVVAMIGSFAVVGPRDPEIWPWLVFGAIAAVGIGLLFHARVARAILGLGVAACGVAAPVSLIDDLRGAAAVAGWAPLAVLGMANAIATTALTIWLSVRAIQALLGRTWAPSLITARLTGATLAVIAANHLWLAAAARAGLASAGFSMGLSTRGTQLAGFPGWPVWHLALAIIGLMMLVGPRRLVARAATMLVLWCACLTGLVVIAGVVGFVVLDAPRLGAMLTLYAVFQAGLFTYLAWWLRDELRRQAAV